MRVEEVTLYELPFGPAHPGSGNFHVHLWIEGERVVRARADPGYLHRGFEKLHEYRDVFQGAVLADRIAVFEPLNWELVFSMAVEDLLGIEVPERAKYIRTLLSELTRIQSHFIWFAATSLGIGFDTGFKLVISYRDLILDLFEALAGHRVYTVGYIRPGGVRWDLPEGFERSVSAVLDRVERFMHSFDRVFFRNPLLVRRTRGVGVLHREDVFRLGATGVVARASGVDWDLRRDAPYEAYGDLEVNVPVRDEGDAYARYLCGRDEVYESIRLCREILKRIPGGDHRVRVSPFAKLKAGRGFSRAEIARGEACCYVVSDGSNFPYRVKYRGPSFTHLIPVLEHLLVGAQIADVPVIYWSLNHCPADMDR